MKIKTHTSAGKQLQRLAICSASIYGAITAHALTVNGTQTLGPGGSSSETEVRVGTNTANSQLNIINHTLSVSDYFRIGDGGNLGGSVVQTGGLVDYNQTLNPGGTSQFLIGHWNGNANAANYNISSGELRVRNAETFVGWDGTGNLNVSGTGLVNVETLTIQRVRSAGTSTLNVSGNGVVNTTFLNMGAQRGAGNVLQSGGTINVTGGNGVRVGHWGVGSGSTYTMTGGQLNVNSGLYVGWDGAGTMTVGGTADVNAGFIGLRGNNSVLNINGGTVDTGNFFLGEASGRNTTVNQNGGDVTVTGGLRVGHWGSETSTYNISGGTLNLTGSNGGFEQAGAITLGVDGTGIFNQSGGLVVAESVRLDSRGATGGIDQYNLTGGTLALRAGGIAGNGNTATYEVNLGGGTIRADESFSIATPVTLTGTNGDTTFDTNGNNITTNQVFSGPGGIIKEGAGTLNMSAGNQTFTGGVTINGGIFNPTGGSWTTSFYSTGAGQRTITVNNTGTLLTGSGAGGGAHDLGGLGAAFSQPRIVINEGGTWQLNREQYLSANNLDLNGGTVNIVNNDLRLQGGTLAVGASPTGSEITGNQLRIFGNVTFNVADGAATNDLLISAPITESGSRSITKTGDGTMTLTGNAAHTGSTTVSGGTLQVSGGGAITSTSGVVIGSAGAMTLDGGSLTTSGNLDLSAAGARLNLIQNGDVNVGGSTIWGAGTIFDDSLAGDSILTPGGGTLASTASSILDLNNPGDVFDLSGTLDLTAGGTIDGFGLLDGMASSSAIWTGQFTYEMLLIDADSITGTFSTQLFGDYANAVGSAGLIQNNFDFFLDNRSGNLFLMAQIPEPGSTSLLGVGVLMTLLRRKRS